MRRAVVVTLDSRQRLSVIFVVGLLAISGLLVILLGSTWAWRGYKAGAEVSTFEVRRPVEPLAAVRPGSTVHVRGTVTQPDTHPSPSGGSSAAHLAIDLDYHAVGRPSLLKLRHGAELELAEGDAVAIVDMSHAQVLDRDAVTMEWYPSQPPPKRIQPLLQQHGVRIPRPRANSEGPELRFRERAFRSGEELTISGVVLGVDASPNGNRTVRLGTDGRTPLLVSNASASDMASLRANEKTKLIRGLVVLLVGAGLMVAGLGLAAALAAG